jgi:hypothetical protein
MIVLVGAVKHPVVYANEAHASILRGVLGPPYVCVLNRDELIAACASGNAVAFVDMDLLEGMNGDSINAPIIALMDHKPAEALAETVRMLDTVPWLAHVLSVPMLQTPRGKSHLEMLMQRIANGPDHAMLGANGRGRTAMLASASRREARFERMREYFAKQGLGDRLVTTVIDVAEELVMNALYDAPVESGFFQRARQRFEDVNLPPDRACEISYGIEEDTVFIRLRDPFGALSRSRLLEVLNRCNNTNNVQLDESRGGAGLGLWRVFQAASTLSITVVPQQLTEVLVGIGIKDGRKVAKPAAVHLFFAKPAGDQQAYHADEDLGLIDNSITFVHVA